METQDDIAGWLARQAQVDRKTRDFGRSAAQSAERPTLSDLFPEAVFDASGCVMLEHRSPIKPCFPTPEAALAAVRSETRLLYGIGARHSSRLHEEGYTSLDALLDHPRWRDAAAALLERWGTPPAPNRVYETLARWLPASSPLFLAMLGLIAPNDAIFFDLETLGLGGAPIFLGAVGRFSDGSFVVRQYLAPSPAEEVSVLERMTEEIAGARALVSFNGKAFDATMLRERCAYYGLPFVEAPIHVDLLHAARQAFVGRIPDCRLGTIERSILGIEREGDLPSEQVPFYYTLFLETGSATVLEPIIRHNRQDLISLAYLAADLLRRADVD